MKTRSLVESLNFAVGGVMYTVRTQHNMRIHALLALLVLVVALALGVSRLELAVLVLTISGVMVTEMINTAVESAVDLAMDTYHPLAEVAKNVAAGAVLLSATASVFIGYLIFFGRLAQLTEESFARVDAASETIVLVALASVLILVVLVKAGAPPLRVQGGFPSAHAALAFSLATLVFLLGTSGVVTLLSVGIAVLVGQARIEARIHTLFEVISGSLLGVLITVFVFQILMA